MPTADQKLKVYKEIFDHSIDGIAIIDPQGRYIEQNLAHGKLLGFADSELIGKTPAIHLGEEAFQAIAQELSSKGFYRAEVKSVSKEGKKLDIELSAFAVKNETGAVSYYIGIKRDITLRNQVRLALEESEERFRQVAENVEEVFWMTDVEKRQILYISPAYEKIWGRTRDSLYQNPRSFLDAIHPEDRERVKEAMIKQPLGNFDETYRITHLDGRIRWIRDRAFAVRNSIGEIYRIAGIAEDVTPIVSLEQKLLGQERMAAVGALAAGVAHELRNPLFGISAAAQVLVRESADNLAMKELGESMLSEIERLNRMLKNLLMYAKPPRLEKAEVEPRELFSEFASLNEQLLSLNGLKLLMSFDPPSKKVWADPTQIRQVILNLGLNAIQSSDPGSAVRIQSQARSGENWLIEIHNDGAAIPPENLPYIFDPFFSTRKEGSGLGLSICKKIIEDHGGSIQCESSVSKGTSFVVKIPQP